MISVFPLFGTLPEESVELFAKPFDRPVFIEIFSKEIMPWRVIVRLGQLPGVLV